jgi:triacylglycerol lipase
MGLTSNFFENPEEWVKAYNERAKAYEDLVDKQRGERKKFETERESALALMIDSFSKEIQTSQEELTKVAPIFAADVEGIPGRRAAYTDRMSALLAKMSLLAYINFEDPDKRHVLERTLAHAGMKVAKCIAVDDTEVYVAEAKDFIIVAFRGTTSALDKKTDFSLFTEQIQVVNHPKKVRVHRGFYAAYLNVEAPLHEVLSAIDKKPIYLTGHSLGGAVALVASAALAGHDILGERIAAVYTFGCPRVGGPDFANIVKAPHYRVFNSGDIVPMVPPNWLRGYRHTGQPVFLKKDAIRPMKRNQRGSAFIIGFLSILMWPFSRQMLFRAAHDISLYSQRLDRIAKYRGKYS